MGVPVAYIFFDIAVNAAFGYFFLKYYHEMDDGGLQVQVKGKGKGSGSGSRSGSGSGRGQGRGDEDWLGYRLHGKHGSGGS
jgi:hypothetical protein